MRRTDPECLEGVDAVVTDGAQVGPAVPKVELVGELFTGTEPGEGDPAVVEDHLVGVVKVGVGGADPLVVGGPELVEVGAILAGEGVVDRGREVVEAVGAGRSEDPPGSGPEVLAVSLDEVDADGQPGAAHPLMLSEAWPPDGTCPRALADRRNLAFRLRGAVRSRNSLLRDPEAVSAVGLFRGAGLGEFVGAGADAAASVEDDAAAAAQVGEGVAKLAGGEAGGGSEFGCGLAAAGKV